MSTKTLRKRVALIAVSAMGFGLISGVTPANAAGEVTYRAADSLGVIANAGITSGTDSVATMLTTGQLALNVAAGSSASPKIVVSAGAYISGGNETVAANQLSATGSSLSSTYVIIKTTLAAGSTFTVTSYASDATGAAVQGLTTVTVAGSSVSGTVVPANSTVVWTNTNGDAATLDAAGASETTTGTSLNLNIQLKDAYKASITSTSGALVVTASSGAYVKISSDANAVSGTGTFSTAVSNVSPADINAVVTEATAGAGWSGTVTVTYNGVVVATKSGKITGNVAKLEIAAAAIGKNNGSASAKSLTYKATDASGNVLALNESLVVYSLSSNTGIISTADGTVSSTTTDLGYGAVTCVSGATGSADVTLQTTVSSTGVTIKSNTVAVLCGGAADNYTAAWDKATYAQGDIATLTVTFKDIKGALANSYDSIVATDNTTSSITTPMMKIITSWDKADTVDVKGQKTYKFNVGDVTSFAAGKFSAVAFFKAPANGTSVTASYTVTGAGGVSNSDILASIVKLITAINKQIAALQKLLLKK